MDDSLPVVNIWRHDPLDDMGDGHRAFLHVWNHGGQHSLLLGGMDGSGGSALVILDADSLAVRRTIPLPLSMTDLIEGPPPPPSPPLRSPRLPSLRVCDRSCRD